MDGDPFFKLRDGELWVCWLGGRPAINLGDRKKVVDAMQEFLRNSDETLPASARPASRSPSGSVLPPAAERPSPAQKKPDPGLEHRLDKRHEITIVARIRTPTGSRDVTVQDLSEKGCRFGDRTGYLTVGTPITLKLGPIGPVEAMVRWREGTQAGVEFVSPLYPSVLDHIRQHFDLRNFRSG